MVTTAKATENRLPVTPVLMRSLLNSRSSLGVIRFFADHPQGKFSRLAIRHAVGEDCGRPEIERALTDLVGAGVLRTRKHGVVCYYRLTDAEPVRGIVLKTAGLEWRRWELIFARA
jgi:hypothetical protein